jgi:4-hydroxybutyryl-CoA dehydratase/vinylacetyl-CoA-Delta-isomerase
MMTPEQYEKSLEKLNLKIYLFGERVDDPVHHPLIRSSMNAVAKKLCGIE